MPLFNGRNYSPTELLAICKVNSWLFRDAEQYVQEILAVVVTEKSAVCLQEALKAIVTDIGRQVSIGQALEWLHAVADMPDELQGGLDGLDALTYHLSGSACSTAIRDLQCVLDRFKEDAKP